MNSLLHYISLHKHKNNKFLYNIVSVFRYYLPSFIKQPFLNCYLKRFERLNNKEKEYVAHRVNYYNHLSEKGTAIKSIANYQIYNLYDLKRNAIFNGDRARSTYIFDSHEYLSYFPQKYKAGFLFGDITIVPPMPSFVKSRPIKGDITNSIIFPLDKIRHFTFLKDNLPFTEKKDMLIGMAFVDQPHRKRFWELYFNHSRCHLGDINKNNKEHKEWQAKPIGIDEHLKYRYIACIEGNDVATNLKWVMSSNSLAVMPKPKYETWFMEGTLIGGYHYVEIKDDYSDLIEKMDYYSSHIEESLAIIEHAHLFVQQFFNKKREKLIAFMTSNKYFTVTKQK